MGLFNFLYKKPKAPKITVYDLIYAYYCHNKPWNPFEECRLLWDLENCYDGFDFSGQWTRIIELGLIEKASPEEKLRSMMLANLKDFCNGENIHVSGKKEDYVQAIISSGLDSKATVGFELCAMSSKCKELLQIHDYIPIVRKYCKEIPFGHSDMFKIREKHPEWSKYDVILLAASEDSFIDYYVESDDYYDSKADKNADIRSAKSKYRDFEKRIRQIEAAEKE